MSLRHPVYKVCRKRPLTEPCMYEIFDTYIVHRYMALLHLRFQTYRGLLRVSFAIYTKETLDRAQYVRNM